jgi:hypothetical protein
MVIPAANNALAALDNGPAPGYILKLVLFFVSFMFYTVLIMNTSICHVITYSLLYIMDFFLNCGIKICRILPMFLT